jgi:hypothetical protein
MKLMDASDETVGQNNITFTSEIDFRSKHSQNLCWATLPMLDLLTLALILLADSIPTFADSHMKQADPENEILLKNAT